MLFYNLDQETLKLSETSAGDDNFVSILILKSGKDASSYIAELCF